MRDDFPDRVKNLLAKRVNYCCSNPSCRRSTAGPHRDPNKAVSIGVAAHITAAASGGARYDASLSAESRKSIENGIWLCQSCATLIDCDEASFTVARLLDWKAGAESIASWRLETKGFPERDVPTHTQVPLIYGLPYKEARDILIAHSWQPYTGHWSHGFSIDVRQGNGPVFWERGYHELIQSSGTGYAFCRFEFVDVYQNRLVVVTAGEEYESLESHACVVRWFFNREAGAN